MNSLYIETYGCQMNVADSELVASIMTESGFAIKQEPDSADVIFINTCSVRENAEVKIYHRLNALKQYRKKNKNLVVGVLGCMAERLKSALIEKSDMVSIVVGPDEYRTLPELVEQARTGEKGIAVKLSKVETYDNILPLRTEGISAWLSIMRGCDKFCTYCIVPFTRGRERSRPLQSLVNECITLWDKGFKEVTLLGQNVNSYKCPDSQQKFPELLAEIARQTPQMRIRYTTSHPIDMSDALIETMAKYDNICNYIHLPVQSGSDTVLKAMNRKYSREHYLGRIEKIRSIMPKAAITTDIIAGFPTETEDDHKQTLSLMEAVRYDGAYMFQFSSRENTRAAMMKDDVPPEVKHRRLSEIIELQNKIAKEINRTEHGAIHEVLVEGTSKKNENHFTGRTDTNKVAIFPSNGAAPEIGTLVKVKIVRSTSATLFAEMV